MMMKPIRTEDEYKVALATAESLWDKPAVSADGDTLAIITMLIEDYERCHHPIMDPDPINCFIQIMDERGLSRKDVEQYIGPRGRVSDILNKVRPLSLEMIRRLASGLKIPADVLIKPYNLRDGQRRSAA
jgi:HTH-type transcriptional regulator/antitoxin HigA